jgi:hypothetical protein
LEMVLWRAMFFTMFPLLLLICSGPWFCSPYVHRPCFHAWLTLKMEALDSSEPFMRINQTTQRYIQESILILWEHQIWLA